MFDFFGLPRELRDMIYDNLDSTDRQIPLARAGKQLLCIATDTPALTYRLVSRQFNIEYLQRIRNKPCLRIEDRLHNPSDVPDPKVPANVAGFSNLQFELYVSGESDRAMRSDLESHRERIDFVAKQMKGLRRLRVHLHVERPRRLRGCPPSLLRNQEIMTGIQGLTELQVSCVSFEGEVENWDYSKTSAPVARWQRGIGLMLCEDSRS